MNIEESVTYIKEKIKNKLPEYTETFVDGKPYRINVLQLETRWTEKTAEAIETLLTAYEKEKEKNKKIDEFCRKELAFERRLKRENREPDEFNQGRFYVSENIRKIIEEE